MPNVKRIRQDQEAAQKRYATYADQIAAYNANVDQVNAANQSASDLYNQQAAEYNAWTEQIKAGQSVGVAKTPDGRWALLGSHNGEYAWSVRDKRGNPMDATQMYGSLAEGVKAVENGSGQRLPWSPTPVFWVKNADGTATQYAGSAVEIANPNYNPNDWFGGADQPQTITQTQWQPTTVPIRIAEFNTPAPTPQSVSLPTPEEPKGWNPSLREIDELRAPTVDAAGAQMATARGEGAKTGLVNEAVGRDSAFADPEDPNNLADKGILARVLGGQL